ncbi:MULTISPECIES: YdcF family protein [Clostridium]|uniref:YdcF family protein n=1 Tax=Clostridium TaxID=1485 RepID=UPI0005FB17C0|nr:MULTISPECIES: YdcF family protein [Clostridium]MDB2150583.1 YdcF family protein [Clostridium butyricum]
MKKGREFIEEITSYIFVEDKIEKSDIIFVPGGLYPEPMEKACDLYLHGYAPYILPSGKFSMKFNGFTKPESKKDKYKKDYKTEFEFLKDVAIINGVPEEVVLKEDCATWTKQNAFNSKRVTDKLGLNVKKAIICCKSFHAKRCLMFYSWAYQNTKFIVCPVDVDGINKENWFKSEYGIQQVMGELSRCGGQFKSAVESWRID